MVLQGLKFQVVVSAHDLYRGAVVCLSWGRRLSELLRMDIAHMD